MNLTSCSQGGLPGRIHSRSLKEQVDAKAKAVLSMEVWGHFYSQVTILLSEMMCQLERKIGKQTDLPV